MNRNFFILILLIALTLAALPLTAQTVVQIGTGTTRNGPATEPTPYGTYYKNFRQQYLYKASEIQAQGGRAGTITNLGFYIYSLNNISTVPLYSIRMKHTTQNVLSTTFEAGSYQTVWQQTFYAPSNTGWTNHALSTPFVWDGTSNILIDILTSMAPISTENASVNYTSTLFTNYSSLRFQSNTVNASTAVSGDRTLLRANLLMAINSIPEPASCVSPTNVGTAFCNTSLYWSANGGPVTGYRLYFGTDGGGTTTPTSIENGTDLGNVTSYTPVSYLPVNTTYYWQVVPYNAIGEAEDCPIWSFSTVPLSGNIGIGIGSTFSTFTSAINVLNFGGVAATGVTFKVANQTFTEGPPPITASGNASGRIVFEPVTTSANPILSVSGSTYGFRLDGADYVTFDNIDVSGPNTVYSGYWIMAEATNNIIRNCTFNIPYNAYNYAVLSEGPNHDLSIIGNSNASNTYSSVYVKYGTGGLCYNLLIQGNTFTNAVAYPIYVDYAEDVIIDDNYIQATAAGAGYFYGITTDDNISNAEILNNTVTGTGSGSISAFYIHGNNISIHNNTVIDFNAPTGGVTGFNVWNADIVNIYSNLVQNIYTNSTSTHAIAGIRYENGSNHKIYNNMISGLSNPTSTGVPQVYGITTENTGTSYISNNTIYLNASGNSANFTTTGISFRNNSNPVLQNNIIVNLSTPGSSGKSVAVYSSTSSISQLGAGSDKNIYYCGTPDASHVIGYLNGVSYSTLAEYKTAAATNEQGSYTELVPFVSTTDLHIDPSITTIVESHAIPLAWVTDDIDGDIRNASNPDIGADEGDFASPYCQPANLLMPAVGASVFCNQPMTWAAGGGAAPTGYRLYVGTDNPPTNLMNGVDLYLNAGYVYLYLPVSVRIYWKVVPYNASGDAENCPVWYFDTVPLSGEFDINAAGGDFGSFTEAINLLNHSGVTSSGATFKVAGSSFNESPPPVTASGTPSGRIVFQPETDTAEPVLTITDPVRNYGFKLQGADYVTFNNIDITGPNTVQYGYWLTDGATHNRIQNCRINIPYNNSVPNSAIYSFGANDYGDFIGNLIETDTYYGFYFGGSEGNYNAFNQIQYNSVPNNRRTAVMLDYAAQTIVSDNYISSIVGCTTAFYAIWVRATCDNTQLYSNTIHGTSTAAVYGMYLLSGNCMVHHNTITDLHSVVTGGANGIWSQGGNSQVYNNLISNLQYSGTQTNITRGIYLGGVNNIAYNNMISGLKNPNGSSSPQIYGMMLYSWESSFISNNTIFLNAAGSTADFSTSGLFIGPSALVNLQNNIIVNLSTPGSSGFVSCLYSPTGTTGIVSYGSDNNIYYCGTPDATHLVGSFNGVNYSSLTEYQAASGSNEQHSMTELVPFVSMADPVDVHIDPTQYTLVEGNAIPLAWVSVDFDSNIRNTTTPDIGADEGDFLSADCDPAVLASPDNGSEKYCNASLHWSFGGGTVTGYKLYFGTDGGGTTTPANIVNGQDLGNVTDYIPLNYLPVNTTFYWKVVPYNAVNEAADCPIWSFGVIPLSGNVYIGANHDLPDFTTAISVLNYGGIDPLTGVNFKVLNGTYVENTPPLTCSGNATGRIVFEPAEAGDQPVLSVTDPVQLYGFKLDGADYVTFNNIDVNGPGSVKYGFWLTNAATHSIITGCDIDIPYTSVTNHAIYSNGTNSYGLYSYNTVENTTYYAVSILGVSGAHNVGTQIQNNHISNTAIGIYTEYSTDIDISHNYVSCGLASVRPFNGITVGNIAYNADVSYNTVTGSSSGEVFGIRIATQNYASSSFIHNNTITDLTSTSSGNVNGIRLIGVNSTISSNHISNLSYLGTGNNVVSGIYINGNNSHISNNMIYGLNNPNGVGGYQIYGIHLSYAGNNYMCNNTVFLNAIGNSNDFNATGMYFYQSSVFYFYNNIIVNLSVPGNGGKALAIKSDIPISSWTGTSDANIYYCGTPNSGHAIAYCDYTLYATLDDFQSAIYPNEQNSMTELVSFVSITVPVDLHLRTDQPTLAEGNGIPFAWITDDFDGDLRNATSPDIGADEGNFMSFGIEAPLNPFIFFEDGEYYLVWESVIGAVTYNIYYSDDPYADLPWTLIETVVAPDTDYGLVPSGQKGFYYVTAVSGARE